MLIGTPDEMLDSIYSICNNASTECVPERVLADSKKSSKVKCFRKSLTNRRRRIVKRLTKLKSPATCDKLRAEMIDIEKKLQKSYRVSRLSFPLTVFWRRCLDDGYIPPRLKKSIITPIYKGDSRGSDC